VVGIFRQKNPGNALVLLVYGLILKFGIILKSPGPLKFREDHYLYDVLLRMLSPLHIPNFVYGVFAFLLIYLQATILNKICIDQKMMAKPNYLPGMAYMLMSSLFIEWNFFSAALLVNTLLIFIFYRMVELYNSTKAMSKIFNIGLLTGFVTLLYQPALVFVLMLPFSLFIMRPFRIREWLVGLLGITVPYYFLALEPLFTNRWSWRHLLPYMEFDFPAMPSSIFITISTVLMVVPFIIGGFFVQANLNKMLIQIRKAWSLLLLFLIFSIFIILVNGGVNYVNWSFGLMSVAAFHGATYYYPTKRLFPLILHWITFFYAIYLIYWM
jgi:hypothetical protein